MGDAAVFAFYPNKQMTTGEGGLIVTSRGDWEALVRSLRNQGRDVMDAWLKHKRPGYNYRLDENPGMGNAGLYYYYNTFAKTLSAVGLDTFQDAAGTKHDWRKDLVGTLASLQKPDGSWVNENNRWLEGDPNLVTAYALLALTYSREKN